MIRKGLLFSAPVLVVILIITVYGWTAIEPGERIASHFNINGEANGYMRKEPFLLLMAGLSFGLTAMFAFLPLITPRKENLYKSAAFYLTGWIGALVIIGSAEIMIIRAAVTETAPSIAFITVPVAVLIIVIGNFMAKSRSNWLAGVRTPWTLSSEHAWKVANRTTGWLFVLSGLGSIAATIFVSERMGLGVLLAGALTAGLAGVVVSYFAWRGDPDRHGAGADS